MMLQKPKKDRKNPIPKLKNVYFGYEDIRRSSVIPIYALIAIGISITAAISPDKFK